MIYVFPAFYHLAASNMTRLLLFGAYAVSATHIMSLKASLLVECLMAILYRIIYAKLFRWEILDWVGCFLTVNLSLLFASYLLIN